MRQRYSAVLLLCFFCVNSNAELLSCDGETVIARGTSLYNGVVSFNALLTNGEYRLVDCERNIFTLDMHRSTNFKKARHFVSRSARFDSAKQRAAVSAHWAAQRLYDLYSEQFDWQGYDDHGSPLCQYVHYGKEYFNAVFDQGTVVYGDGGAYNSTAIVSADYVGHEVTHGVTLHTAGLLYDGESGALNESFSDIFGKVLEHTLVAERHDNWDMFADIYRDSGMSTRSMSNPETVQVPWDKTAETVLRRRGARGQRTVLKSLARDYLGPYWSLDIGNGSDLYINAGPQNHWFYLLTNGGSGTNFLGHEYDVVGVGLQSAAAIAWRNLSVYLQPDSDYLDARYGAEQAAIDLFGPGSQENQSVAAAWGAVAVIEANYRRLPRPDRNFLSFELIEKAGEETIAYDVAAGTDMPHPDALLTSADYPGVDLWLVHSSSSVKSYSEFVAYQNWTAAAGRTYEIRFTANGGEALFEDEDGMSGVYHVPFEVWDTGASTSTSLDDVRFIPIVFDIDKNKSFGLFGKDKSSFDYAPDHHAVAGDLDRWTDLIHIAAPRDLTPGQSGYDEFLSGGDKAIASRHLMWLSLIRPQDANAPSGYRPQQPRAGQVFRIVLSRADRADSKRRPQPVSLQESTGVGQRSPGRSDIPEIRRTRGCIQ